MFDIKIVQDQNRGLIKIHQLNRRAQAQSQIFVYVLAIIITTTIFIYGYSAISSFKNQVDNVELLEFQNDLRSAIKVISTDYESTKIYNSANPLYVPEQYEEVCFAQVGAVVPQSNYPLIADSISVGAKPNVFLVGSVMEESFYVGNVVIDDPGGFFCTSIVNGRIGLKLEGLGNKAKIIKIQ